MSRFLSLLEDRSLYLARADLMSDPWEGAFGEANAALRPNIYGEQYAKIRPQMTQLFQQLRSATYLSCWHDSAVESAAMWGLYQRDGRALAIRTTWGNLTSNLRSPWKIFGSRVSYVDYQRTFIPENSMFGPYVHKRQSFAFEKEVRIFLCTFIDRELHPANGVEPKTGYKVELALDQAIDTVFIAPEAPKWFVPLIESLIKRYQLSWPVQQSDLVRDPVW